MIVYSVASDQFFSIVKFPFCVYIYNIFFCNFFFHFISEAHNNDDPSLNCVVFYRCIIKMPIIECRTMLQSQKHQLTANPSS